MARGSGRVSHSRIAGADHEMQRRLLKTTGADSTGALKQRDVVSAVEPLHPLAQCASGGPIEWLPAHPHEGVVSARGDSSFHHLSDCNWNPNAGAPSFVT